MTFVKDIPLDDIIQPEDYVLSTDPVTGKQKSDQWEKVFAQLGALLMSSVSVRNLTITETASEDFIQIINEDIDGIPVYASEVLVIEVLDENSIFKALYLLYKVNVSGTVTYGSNQSQLALTDMIVLKEASTIGEVNTASSSGSGASVFNQKVGVDLEFKSLKAGTNIEITTLVPGEILINFSGSLGESNTVSNVGAGEVQLYRDKVGADLGFKTMTFQGAQVDQSTDPDTIDVKIWSKLKTTEDTLFDLSQIHSNTTIWFDNGANDITVQIPFGLSSDFQCAFYQLGTGDITIATSAGAPALLGGNNAISGQFGSAWLERDPEIVDQLAFFGDVKLIP